MNLALSLAVLFGTVSVIVLLTAYLMLWVVIIAVLRGKARKVRKGVV